MTKARFRLICIILSLAGTASGLFLPILNANLGMFGGSGSISMWDILESDIFNELRQVVILLLPFALGIITAVFCMMKSRPIKVIFSAVTAVSIVITTPMIKTFILEISGVGYLGRGASGFASSMLDKVFSFDYGYYIFIGCFAACFLFALLGIRKFPESAQASGVQPPSYMPQQQPPVTPAAPVAAPTVPAASVAPSAPIAPAVPDASDAFIATPQKPAAISRGLFCTECGNKNEPDARFCENCGAPLK